MHVDRNSLNPVIAWSHNILSTVIHMNVLNVKETTEYWVTTKWRED